MPGDLVWVALISSGSALLASIFVARLTYEITKRQTEAQTAEVKKQIEHQEEEARRDRTIEARKGSLIAVRDTLSRLVGAYSSFSSRIVNVRDMNEMGIPTDDPGRQRILTQMQEAEHLWIEDVNSLETILAPLSDNELIALVEDFNEGLGQITMGDSPNDFNELAARMKEVRDRLSEYRLKLVPVNRRIEELLSGDDLK